MSADVRNAAEIHSAEEIEQAVRALGAADLKRLRAAARVVLRSVGLDTAVRDHEDLLSEALVRTLKGSRGWRKGVGFVRHLSQTMRSVAWKWRERQELESRASALPPWEAPVLPPDDDGALDPPGSPFSSGLDIEAELLCKEQVELFEHRFADDRAALRVMAGWAWGWKGPEIRERNGMSTNEFQAAVRRVRRFAQRGESHVH